MKKFVSLLLAVLMVASLAACGQKTDAETSPAPDESAATLKILDTEYVTEDYAIAVNKGNTALLDKINVAPKLFGGASAKSPVGGAGIAEVAQCVRLKNPSIQWFGDDILIESEVDGTCSQES